MRVREAKHFLVQQTAEQAALENVPLSDLERRRMYFTEGKGAIEDPVTLNEEFEATYDSAAYEKKISGLMRQAYRRLKNENPERARQWSNAIQTLSKGDHYILVLCGSTSNRITWRYWRIYVAILLPVVTLYGLAFLFFPRRDGNTGPLGKYIPALTPQVEILAQVFFWTALITAFLFPRTLIKLGSKCLGRIFNWALRPLGKDESNK